MPEIVNPTPEFNNACIAVMNEWRTGILPLNETIARLAVLVQRAAADGNAMNQARAEQILANVQLTRGNLDACIQHAQRARTLASAFYNPARLAIIDITEGESHRFKGNTDEAIRLYRSAYAYAGEINDTVLQTYSVVNSGLTLLSLKRLEEAQQAFLDGLSLSKQWADPDAALGTLCEIHHGLATIHLELNHPQRAWDEAHTAYQIAQRSTDQRHHGLVNRTLGAVITHLDHVPDANFSNDPDDYFRASLEYFRELNAEAEIMLTTYAQAVSLAKRGNINSATRKLQQVIIAFTRLGMEADLQRALAFRKTILA
jgi:tetratricopeptide (TPR) repeat protein